ncbi:MAG: hypothetical protein H6P95_2789, partial [Candidatus Aminicenantes bacterium]|nr:hypothetical protein [Candidatus Aminicenantes bacterium]
RGEENGEAEEDPSVEAHGPSCQRIILRKAGLGR